MFDNLKSRFRSALAPAPPLSIAPERKGISFQMDGELLGAEQLALNGFPRLAALRLGGAPAWSGEPVSNATAMSLSTVYACNKIISESVGFLPCSMVQTDGKYTNPAVAHPLFNLLKFAPNCEQTSQTFFELLTSHSVMSGNGFAQIMRRSGTNEAVGMYPILPENVMIDRDASQRLIYVVKERNQPDSTYTVQRGKPQDILHLRGLGWDGLRGYSVVTMARQSFGTALAQERNVAAFYANGGRVPYLLKLDDNFENRQEADAYRAAWSEIYNNPHIVPILEKGWNYQQIGMSAADAQLLESRQFTIPEICRWFSVSPHMVADLSKATFSNIEALSEQFVRYTLQVHLTRWEQELWRCVLTPDEQRQGYSFRHDLSILTRGDTAVRMAAYATLLQNGVDCINDVLEAEGRNPVEGGDVRHIQVNQAALGSDALNSSRPAIGPIKQ